MWKDNQDNEVVKKRLINAAKRANILSFVNSLENGFKTLVGDRGVNYLADKNRE